MQKKKLSLAALTLAAATFSLVWAADHIDAPSVKSTSADITDYYAFQSPENQNNMVFVCNLTGLMSPGETQNATFDENIMVEFNIDNSRTFKSKFW